jgi:tRNA A37 threonylcarbamoyladenosine dehydratase
VSSCARTEILIGKNGLLALANSHIIVCGLGGVGGILAESLVRAGVGEITLIDFDNIELSDTNRQIIALHSTLGQQKVDVLKARLKDINPSTKINAINKFIDETHCQELALSDANFIADCIDSIHYKTLLIKHCLTAKKPIISAMGAGGKLDGSKVQISRMDKTLNCPLAREMRKRCRDNRIKMNFPVVYSSEVGKKALPHAAVQASEFANAGRPKATNGAISYMPNIFGLMMASFIINNILENK